MASFNYPEYGSKRWKSPVATAANLPTIGSVAGDARVTLDTLNIYIFNGTIWSTSSPGSGDVVGPASATSGAIATYANTTGKLLTQLTGNGVVKAASNVASISTIVNADVSASAAIEITKIAQGTANQIIGANSGATANEYKTISVGTSGTDFAIANAANSIVLNLPTASAANRGALSSADWSTFNGKQAAGNYITALTGEVTASGPGSAAATVTNSAVIGKVLTGFVSGAGTVADTDTILQAFNKINGNVALKAPSANPTFTGTVIADTIQTSGSSGIALKNSGGTTVVIFGPTNTTNVSFAGVVNMTSPNLTTPVLGTPTSGNLVNCTGYTIANVAGLGTGVATFLATPSSANLAAAVTDETGSGALVFGTAPVFTTQITTPIVYLSGSTPLISSNTSDGSDNAVLQVWGGGAGDVSRGAGINLFGNENASTGKLRLYGGNVSGGNIEFYTGAAVAAMVINQTDQSVVPQKLLDLSTSTAGQIKFPTTQNASSNTNTLDDYEEGSFSPEIQVAGSSVGIAYSVNTGNYTKVGKLVFITGTVQLSNKGGSSGSVTLVNIPFTNANTTGSDASTCSVSLIQNFVSTAPIGIKLNQNATTGNIYKLSGTTFSALVDTDIGNTSAFYFSGCYMSTN